MTTDPSRRSSTTFCAAFSRSGRARAAPPAGSFAYLLYEPLPSIGGERGVISSGIVPPFRWAGRLSHLHKHASSRSSGELACFSASTDSGGYFKRLRGDEK